MSTTIDRARFLARRSFIELGAEARAEALLDPGSGRVLLGPFARLKSPWLGLQNIVTQADDGVVLMRGTLEGRPALVAAIESAFQGGSMGEVSGAKIAAALELALADAERGHPVLPVILFETGGVRLQEANLGLAAIADIHAAIVALRRHVPVIGVIAGMVGCFGGMSLAAGLCSHLIATKQARLGMNGPEVIEQEAGIAELDSSDRRLIWRLIGGEQRAATGFVDRLVEDDTAAIARAVRAGAALGVPTRHRSEQVDLMLARLAAIDPAAPPEPEELRATWASQDKQELLFSEEKRSKKDVPTAPCRGRTWFAALTGEHNAEGAVVAAEAPLGGGKTRFIAVQTDPRNRFPRARAGEVGLEEGWTLARLVRDTIAADRGGTPRPIIAIVDVASQAYGKSEEMLGIHLACAAAANAYAEARLAGHPVVALLVGRAMSGAFLAHGYQANRLLALDAPGVLVHAMGREAAARITRRPLAELDEMGEKIPPMSYDIRNYARLGLLHELIPGIDADAPSAPQLDQVRASLVAAIADIRASGRCDLACRLRPGLRAASIDVRQRLAQEWR